MAKYQVTIRPVYQPEVIDVEAESREEAKSKALDQSGDYETDWEIESCEESDDENIEDVPLPDFDPSTGRSPQDDFK